MKETKRSTKKRGERGREEEEGGYEKKKKKKKGSLVHVLSMIAPHINKKVKRRTVL